jgi:hypothetical protein
MVNLWPFRDDSGTNINLSAHIKLHKGGWILFAVLLGVAIISIIALVVSTTKEKFIGGRRRRRRIRDAFAGGRRRRVRRR